MINIISICEESINNKIQSTLSSIEGCKINSFLDRDSSISFIDNNEVAIAIMSLDMMDAYDITEYIYHMNTNARFIFIYNDLEYAISLFNSYDSAYIFHHNKLDSIDFINTINAITEEYKGEILLQDELEQYRDREKKYKLTMNEMSCVLNSRLVCFEHISNIFSKSIAYITSPIVAIDDTKLEDCFYNIFSSFCKYYFTNDINYQDEIDLLINMYDNPDTKKYLKIDIDSNIKSRNNLCVITYYVFVLVHLFAEFLDKYRIKIEVLQDSKVYRIDCLCDTKLSDTDLNGLILLYDSAQKSISGLCNKVEYANRDGIFQFRIYLLKNH